MRFLTQFSMFCETFSSRAYIHFVIKFHFKYVNVPLSSAPLAASLFTCVHTNFKYGVNPKLLSFTSIYNRTSNIWYNRYSLMYFAGDWGAWRSESNRVCGRSGGKRRIATFRCHFWLSDKQFIHKCKSYFC